MEFMHKLGEQLADEVEGYSMYMKLANMTDNQEEKQKLMNIANEEKNHYMIVRDMIEKYM